MKICCDDNYNDVIDKVNLELEKIGYEFVLNEVETYDKDYEVYDLIKTSLVGVRIKCSENLKNSIGTT